jgi:molybdopterin converting factor small subunit
MAVTVRIPTALRAYAGQNARIDVPAKTAGEALEALVGQHPDLRKHLYEDSGALRSFVNLYLGDQDVRNLEGLDTPVPDGATLLIVPSVAGGRR